VIPQRAKAALERSLSEGALRAPDEPAVFASGLTPSPDDDLDYPFVWSGRPPLAEIDFRPEFPPIKNQGGKGACTGFETIGHGERLMRRAGHYVDLSEEANYRMSRAYLGWSGDSGATLRAALHVGKKFGICSEAVCPYNDADLSLELTQAQLEDAATRKFDAYYRIDLGRVGDPQLARRIDGALADGLTVGIGFLIQRWFYYVRGPLYTHKNVRNRPSPFLAKGQSWTDVMGGHAVLIVGRSETLGGYIVRNSWGTGWGDGGYYLLPFADLRYVFEVWTVAGFDGDDIAIEPYDMDCAEAKAARLYRAAFGRCPDREGLAYQARAVQEIGLLQVARNFMASAEFFQRYGAPDDGAFVRALYRNALGREPDAGGFAYQLEALEGMERAQMLVNFSESPENRNP
jgi:hypothetical protein